MALGRPDRTRLLASIAVLAGAVGAGLCIWHAQAPEDRTVSDTAPESLTQTQRLAAAVMTAPKEAVANNVGVSYAREGRYKEAITHFRMAISYNEDYLPGYKNLLAACVETERWNEALEAATKAEERHPLSVELKREWPPEDPSTPSGAAPLDSAPLDSARNKRDKRDKRDRQDRSLGQAEEKRKELGKDKDFIANLGRAYLESGRPDKVRRRYTLCLRLFPHELRGFNGLGEVASRPLADLL